jgi:hypothetical protein
VQLTCNRSAERTAEMRDSLIVRAGGDIDGYQRGCRRVLRRGVERLAIMLRAGPDERLCGLVGDVLADLDQADDPLDGGRADELRRACCADGEMTNPCRLARHQSPLY